MPRFAHKQGWIIADEYSDHAISGATLMRPGFQAMMAEALRGKVDVVLAEALDRFSRDQEDTAGLFKRLTFAGVGIVTLAEGDITFLHIGLKGTMNAMFLKELRATTSAVATRRRATTCVPLTTHLKERRSLPLLSATGPVQERNRDVNDPASGPAMRPEGRWGSFTSWVPRAASH